MSATELATVVEGWATLVGLFVVVAGAGRTTVSNPILAFLRSVGLLGP